MWNQQQIDAVTAFHLKARRHDIKAVDAAELPCTNVSVAGSKAAEICPKMVYIKKLEAGLYELRRRIFHNDTSRRKLLTSINKLLEKGS